MRQLFLATALLAASAFGPVQAQDAAEVASASGGVLRALDKISGDTVDLEVATGASTTLGNLQIALVDCRYPVGDPAANAYAALEITETGKPGALFSGWMIASSPALNALEHFRYDVWVIRCTTS
ncbi:DUF2155 domain-containing protein [Sulfitobacter delicatus]|uniref:DUF2155 domain-containing protein n=1 Tax=Sulfitobacter delicatus TaxID=218672 RepID=A0A1G7PGR8_9RHOB|nr:DUF2155 domain-containing protein [Sulfitobacter delicatus]SDF85398.1 hypothetical protein SAMN04489759_103325 [Sulfitobacter delicatus]